MTENDTLFPVTLILALSPYLVTDPFRLFQNIQLLLDRHYFSRLGICICKSLAPNSRVITVQSVPHKTVRLQWVPAHKELIFAHHFPPSDYGVNILRAVSHFKSKIKFIVGRQSDTFKKFSMRLSHFIKDDMWWLFGLPMVSIFQKKLKYITNHHYIFSRASWMGRANYFLSKVSLRLLACLFVSGELNDTPFSF